MELKDYFIFQPITLIFSQVVNMQHQDELKYKSPCGKEIPVAVADTFVSRFWGLMGKKEGDYGLLLKPCNLIHTFFMRYPLDAIYLDNQNRVLSMKRMIKPFRITRPVQNATRVLEFPSSLNAMAFVKEGGTISFYQY